MAVRIPPVPLQDIKQLPFSIQEWFRQVQLALSTLGSVGGVSFNALDFSGSNLTSIATRNHNDLQSKQGGSGTSFYHLTAALNSSKTVNFGTVNAVNISTTTQTVTGALTGDAVIITPATQLEAGINVYGYVSASDTITIVANNSTAGNIPMANRTYYITVIRV